MQRKILMKDYLKNALMLNYAIMYNMEYKNGSEQWDKWHVQMKYTKSNSIGSVLVGDRDAYTLNYQNLLLTE